MISWIWSPAKGVRSNPCSRKVGFCGRGLLINAWLCHCSTSNRIRRSRKVCMVWAFLNRVGVLPATSVPKMSRESSTSSPVALFTLQLGATYPPWSRRYCTWTASITGMLSGSPYLGASHPSRAMLATRGTENWWGNIKTTTIFIDIINMVTIRHYHCY